MPDIGLTDFVDFALKSGPTQLTKVREIKTRGDYEPAFDYWKGLREGISDFVRGTITWDGLESVVKRASSGKQRNYAECLRAFARFHRKARLGEPCEPPGSRWIEAQLTVRVTPELAFSDQGQRTALKLYFKADPRPTKDRVDAILLLMRQALPGDRVALLDVRTSRVYEDQTARADLEPYLRSQAHSFLYMWNTISS